MVPTYPRRELKAIHRSRLVNVAEDDIHLDIEMLKNGQRLIRIRCFNDFVATVATVGGDCHPNEDLIVHDKYRLPCGRPIHGSTGRIAVMCPKSWGTWYGFEKNLSTV
jgi:hypothetical protein